MSDFEITEALIARYKVLMHPVGNSMSQDEAFELFSICLALDELGFTQTGDNKDWLPPFTPDAEGGKLIV